MSIKKITKITAIVGGGIVLIGGIAVGVTGLWPVARAGASLITYATFRDNFVMADHFYRSNIKLAGESDRAVDAKEVQRDLQRVTMQGLIEQTIIERELRQRYSAVDLDTLIQNKIAGIDLTSKDMQQATDLMYGLTPGQFKDLVLIPKAKQEILEGNLLLQDQSFIDWLNAQKESVAVSIFVPSMTWDGKDVQVR